MPLGVYVDISNNSAPVKWLGDYHGWTLHKAMGGTWDNFDEYSKNILEFKNGKSWAIDAFKTTISPMLTSQFGISFVPGHDPAKPPGSLKTLIGSLCVGHKREDLSGALARHTKISKLATGGDRSLAVHLGSIRVTNSSLVQGKRILLLDDVTTSGNSLQACSNLLMQAGAEQVWQLALGKTV